MTMKSKLMALVGRAIDEEMPDLAEGEETKADDIATMLYKLMARIDSLEKAIAKSDTVEVAQTDEDTSEMTLGYDDKLDAIQSSIQMLVTMLSNMMTQESDEPMLEDECYQQDEDMDEEDKTKMYDSQTLSKAEILAPGIAGGKNIKARALKEAYKTVDGRNVIDSLLEGKSFTAADKNVLFNAASALIASERKQKQARVITDSVVNYNEYKIMDPKKINEINEKHYNKRGQ